MADSTHVRVHFGAGSLLARSELSVFINCPFDCDYAPVFDGIVFATVCCGFLPRSALESGSACRPRMDRITRAVLSSRYSIHDLSRCKGEGTDNLARFNMPLELGIAMAQYFSESSDHDWLLMVPRGHAYRRFISDVSGYDPKEHDSTPESVVPAVMSWLATRPDAVQTPTPKSVLGALPVFAKERSLLDSDWHNDTPWADLVLLALRVAQECGLVPNTHTTKQATGTSSSGDLLERGRQPTHS